MFAGSDDKKKEGNLTVIIEKQLAPFPSNYSFKELQTTPSEKPGAVS